MAFARARVELKGSLSHSGGPRFFKKGLPQILTIPSHIEYYQAVGGFSVTMLGNAKAKAAPPPPVPVEEPSEDGLMEAELKKMKVAELHEVAKEMGLEIEPDAKKLALIKAILAAQ